MNNKHSSWYKEINNNFIIASRAYFLQSPTCTRVNNLVHIAMWFNTNIHICIWLTPIVHIVMWPTPKGFTRVNSLVHIALWLTPKSTIYLYRSWCSICKELYWGLSFKETPFKYSFMLSRKILHHFWSTICYSHIFIRKAVVFPLTLL